MQFNLVGSIYNNDCTHRNTEKLSTTNERNLCSHYVFTWVPEKEKVSSNDDTKASEDRGIYFTQWQKSTHIYSHAMMSAGGNIPYLSAPEGLIIF